MAAPICVARIGAAHGVRGAVKLWTFTEDPLAVKAYGPLTTRDGARQFEVTHVREAKDHLVATFKGVASREDAERLNGIELYIAREKLPETDDDEYYHADLIGLAAVNAANEPLGRVVAIHNFGAGDISEIAPPSSPFFRTCFRGRSVSALRARRWPRGCGRWKRAISEIPPPTGTAALTIRLP